jgi:hypothetical protein
MSTAPEGVAKAANENEWSELWERARIQAFNEMSPFALSFIATDGPVSVTLWDGQEIKKRIGHNRGVWPAKVIVGTGRGDPTKRTYRHPIIPARMKFRLWTLTKTQRDRVAESAVELIAKCAERDGGVDVLEDGFRDVGPDLDVDMFELEVHRIAQDLGVRCWDDAGLIAFLDRVVERANTMAAKSRGGRYSPLEVALTNELGKGSAK